MKRKDITKEEIKEAIRLYVEENLILVEIAKRLDKDYSTIQRNIKNSGVVMRRLEKHSDSTKKLMSINRKRRHAEGTWECYRKGKKFEYKPIKFTKEQITSIIKLYTEEKKNTRELGIIFNCNNSTIGDILRRNNISKNKKIVKEESRIKMINTLKRLHKEGKLGLFGIAKFSHEHPELVSGKNSGFYGKKQSESAKKKMRDFRLGVHPYKASKKLSELIKEGKIKIGKYNTSIEIKIQNFLKELGIEFFTHQYMHIEHGYQCDILIPAQKNILKTTIIECDGDYWHGNPIIKNKWENRINIISQIEKDKIRTGELIKKGYDVIRIWEKDIRRIDLNDFRETLNATKTL